MAALLVACGGGEPDDDARQQPLARRSLPYRPSASVTVSPPAPGPVDPPASSPPPAPAREIDPTDVLYNLDPARLESYRYATLACYGANRYWWDWGGSSGHAITPGAFPVTNGMGELRADAVPDPDNPFSRAFRLSVAATDPDTSGSGNKRCEMALGWTEYGYPGRVAERTVTLPRGRSFWWAMRFRLDDWSVTLDRQVIFQWLSPYSGDAGPFLAMLVQGSTMRLELHADTSTMPSTATMLRLTPWSRTTMASHWYTLVVRASLSAAYPAPSRLTMWLDGVQVLDYTGALGYSATPAEDYAKFGVYHWTGATNPWAPAVRVRTAHFKGPALVLDRNGYDATMLASLMP